MTFDGYNTIRATTGIYIYFTHSPPWSYPYCPLRRIPLPCFTAVPPPSLVHNHDCQPILTISRTLAPSQRSQRQEQHPFIPAPTTLFRCGIKAQSKHHIRIPTNTVASNQYSGKNSCTICTQSTALTLQTTQTHLTSDNPDRSDSRHHRSANALGSTPVSFLKQTPNSHHVPTIKLLCVSLISRQWNAVSN